MIYVATGKALEDWAEACKISSSMAVMKSRQAMRRNPSCRPYYEDVISSGMSYYFPFLWKDEELKDDERKFIENIIIEGACDEW